MIYILVLTVLLLLAITLYQLLNLRKKYCEVQTQLRQAQSRALKTEENALLSRILSISVGQKRLEESCMDLVDVLLKYFNLKFCSLLLKDQRGKLNVIASNVENRFFKGIQQYCMESMELLSKKHQQARIECSDQYLQYSGAADRRVRYAYCIPLISQNSLSGILLIEHTQANGMERLETDFFKIVTNSLAVAFQNLIFQDQIISQSMMDELTGAYNRRYLENLIQQEIAMADEEESPFVVAMLDIDHFKYINDSYGHPFGDIVLKRIASFIQANMRHGIDYLFRYGGEEFLLYFKDASLKEVLFRLESIREGISCMQLVTDQEKIVKISVSIGVAEYPVHGETIQEILKCADQRLYRAKEQGRNRVVVK